MMCSSWTEAVNRVVWMGSAVHIQNPVPLKSAGNPGEVKYKALEIVLISLHMSMTCVYTVDDVRPAMWTEKFGYTTYSGMLYIWLADRGRYKMATLSQSTLYNGSTALKWHMLIACCQWANSYIFIYNVQYNDENQNTSQKAQVSCVVLVVLIIGPFTEILYLINWYSGLDHIPHACFGGFLLLFFVGFCCIFFCGGGGGGGGGGGVVMFFVKSHRS